MASLRIGNKEIQVHRLTAIAKSSGVARVGACGFAGVIIKLDGTNGATLIGVYDNVSGTTGPLLPTNIVIPAGTRLYQISYDPPVRCDNGVNVQIQSDGNLQYQVKYDDGS